MTNKAFHQFSKDLINDPDYISNKKKEVIINFNHNAGNDKTLNKRNNQPIKKILNNTLVTPGYIASRTIFK